MNKAYEYAKQSIKAKDVPKYVKKQCREFIRIADGKDDKYFLDDSIVKQIENVLKLLVMPKGLKAGQTLYECSTQYQWLFYISVLAIGGVLFLVSVALWIVFNKKESKQA